MSVTHLALNDVGPFEKYEAELSGRMVGVTGPNGAGKSTVLRAVAFALLGDTGCLGRRDAVRIGRDPGAPQPRVLVRFEPRGGAPVTIARWLPVDKKPGRHRLIDGDATLATADEIAVWFEGAFGVPPAQARDVLFVEQNHLTDAVTAPDAKRAEAFQRVFGLEAAARARTAALEHLAALPAPPGAEARAAALAHLRDVEAQADEVEAALLSAPVVDPAAHAAQRVLVAGCARADGLRALARRLDAEVRAARERLDRPAVPAPDPAECAHLRELRARRAAYAAWAPEDARARAAVERCELALRAAAAARAPDPGPAPVEPDRLVALREQKSVFEYACGTRTGAGACPVCAGPYAPDAATRERARAALTDLSKLEAAHRAAVGAHGAATARYAAAVDAAHRAVAALDAAEREAGAVRARCPGPPGPDAAAIEAAWAAWHEWAGAHERDAAERAAATAAARDRGRDLAEVRTELAGAPDPAAQGAAREALIEMDAAADLRRGLEAKQEVLDRALRGARGALARVDAGARAADAVGPHREAVREVVAVLHRDAAPAAAAAAALADLARAVDARLEQIGAAYRVGIDARGDIVCSFADGSPARRAGLLSPGQQMALALAWRVAVVDRYCPRAGVLCLDEPTTGLDEVRIGALRWALDAWRAADAGPQFLVVTHDRRLFGAFDRVVAL